MFSRKKKQAATAARTATDNGAGGKKTPPGAANELATPSTIRQKGGFLKKMKTRREGASAGKYTEPSDAAPTSPPTKRTSKIAVRPPSSSLLAEKATTNPGRQRLIDSQQFILQCMREAGCISAVQEKFVFLRRPNLIRHEDPEVVNYPAGLNVLQQGTIVGYFSATGKRVYHCMMIVSTSSDNNSSDRLFMAGIDNRRVLHPLHACDRRYAKHSVVAREQLKKLPSGTTVRYQSIDTIRQRLLTQPSDYMDSSSSNSEQEADFDDDEKPTLEEGSNPNSSFDSFQNWSEEESFSSVSVYDSSDEDAPAVQFSF